MNQESKPDERAGTAAPRRRAYARPQLERYGKLSDLTATAGNKSPVGDAGTPPSMDKTR